MDSEIQINTLIRYTQVSRETILGFKKFKDILVKSNKNLNLVGKSTLNNIWIRHFLDSAQAIDFIDKKCNIMVDLGSGAGFPGLVLSMIAKDRKFPLKTKLIEKSAKKSIFLENVIEELSLSAEVINKNIFNNANIFSGDVFVARAFKPLAKILELMHSNVKNWKKMILFLGKTGKRDLYEATKIWDIEYKQRVSVTNTDSIILEINKLKKA
jgi:16S rRNA (guanine527-N7)-methyltransferase